MYEKEKRCLSMTLKPCPFCGQGVELEELNSNSEENYAIFCPQHGYMCAEKYAWDSVNSFNQRK